MAKNREHVIHNEYIPPFMDASRNILTFSFMRYHITNTSLLNSLYRDLTDAVKDSNYKEIVRLLKAMEPYRINKKIQKAKRQTRRIDSVTGGIAE